jgi:hypothetical protein
MVRLKIMLTDERARSLRRLAGKDLTSVAALVREAVNRLLLARRGLPEAGVRQRAIRAAGRFHSEHADLSERHDEHAVAGFTR